MTVFVVDICITTFRLDDYGIIHILFSRSCVHQYYIIDLVCFE